MKRLLNPSMVLPLLGVLVVAGCTTNHKGAARNSPAPLDPVLVAQGKDIFRTDTFGDEAFWTDVLGMHQVIATAVDPTTALSVGLKVDAEALPAAVVQGIQNGSISLTDPATTVALLKLNAVVGVKGTVETINGKDTLTRVGTTCALCHSTVDDSFAPGIGKRLDGWANRDLNPGAIIALSPVVPAGAIHLLGQGELRSPIQPGRPERAAGHPSRLWAPGSAQHHCHRRRHRHRLLEPVRGGHADGGPGFVCRKPDRRERDEWHHRPRDLQAPGAAGLPAEPRSPAATRRQL